MLWPLAGLRPKHGFRGTERAGVPHTKRSIDAPGNTFQLATLPKTNQDRILYAGGARLFRDEQAIMLLGERR